MDSVEFFNNHQELSKTVRIFQNSSSEICRLWSTTERKYNWMDDLFIIRPHNLVIVLNKYLPRASWKDLTSRVSESMYHSYNTNLRPPRWSYRRAERQCKTGSERGALM